MTSNASDGASDVRALIEGLADDIQVIDANAPCSGDTSDEAAIAVTQAATDRARERIDRWLQTRPNGATSLGDVVSAAIATALLSNRKARARALNPTAGKRGELLLVTSDSYVQKIFRLSIAPDFEVTPIDIVTEALTRLTIGVRWAHVVVDLDTPDAQAFIQRALDLGARVSCFSRHGVPVELLGRAFVYSFPLLIDEAREYLIAPPRARTTPRSS